MPRRDMGPWLVGNRGEGIKTPPPVGCPLALTVTHHPRTRGPGARISRYWRIRQHHPAHVRTRDRAPNATPTTVLSTAVAAVITAPARSPRPHSPCGKKVDRVLAYAGDNATGQDGVRRHPRGFSFAGETTRQRRGQREGWGYGVGGHPSYSQTRTHREHVSRGASLVGVRGRRPPLWQALCVCNGPTPVTVRRSGGRDRPHRQLGRCGPGVGGVRAARSWGLPFGWEGGGGVGCGTAPGRGGGQGLSVRWAKEAPQRSLWVLPARQERVHGGCACGGRGVDAEGASAVAGA